MRNDDLRLAGFEEPSDSESSRPLLSRQTQSRSAQCVPQTSGRACPLWVISGHVQCGSRCPLRAKSGHWAFLIASISFHPKRTARFSKITSAPRIGNTNRFPLRNLNLK